MSVSGFWLLVGLFLPFFCCLGVVVATGSAGGLHIASKPLSWFILAPQVRKHYGDEELQRLGESMKALGQLQPVGAKPDGTLLWGHRRLLAARRVGLSELQVIVTERPLSDSEIRLIQLTENMHRADLSGHEKWQACAELMSMNPRWQLKDLAEQLHLDPSMVTRLLSPSRCIRAVQEALAAGKIGISDCYAISKLPEKEQAGLLALKLAGASRDAVEQARRKSQNSGKETVRVQKVKCMLPSGITVVVSGEGVSLEESIEALGEAIKEMKRARDLGYTARTFAAAMRDRSKRE
jgi:ParB family chromosome partitioning protein